MATIRLTWVFPTVRESGKPLDPADIQFAELQMSADQGANWMTVDMFPPSVLTTDVNDLEPGTWGFRIRCIDTQNRAGAWNTIAPEVMDTSPPGGMEFSAEVIL